METKQEFCKRITLDGGYGRRPEVLLGLIERQDSDFLYFRTGRRRYILSKNRVILIEETNILFQEQNGDE